MRILTVTNLYPPDVIGGYEMGCGQMVGALRRRGHDVEVLTTSPRWPVPPEPGVHRRLRLTDYHTRLRRRGTGPELERTMDVQAQALDSANVATLLSAIEEHKPDVVYLWNVTYVGGLGLAGALAHLQIPVVWHLMDAVPRAAVTIGGTMVTSAARFVSRRLRARYVVCSQRLVDEIAESGFSFGDRAAMVPNWVEPVPEPRPRTLYPDRTPELRMVAAGQLAPHKGFDLIVDAARTLLDEGLSTFHIDFFGAGLEDHYRRLILEHHLEEHIALRGALPQEELVERFWDYDVFLFPTWSREPFGFAPLEAAARECVPIVSRDCGFAEWCVDGVHALKIDRDAPALTAAVRAVLTGAVPLAPIARRARAAAVTSFTVDTAAEAVEHAFEQAREIPPVRPGRPDETYHLARLAERLAHDWAEQPR